MMEKLYDALRAADGVEDDKARAAAIEAAEFDRVFADIRSTARIAAIEAAEFGRMRATLRLHTWILGINAATLLAILGGLYASHR